jgi:hypothetical protein
LEPNKGTMLKTVFFQKSALRTKIGVVEPHGFCAWSYLDHIGKRYVENSISFKKQLALKERGATASPKKFCEIRNRNKDKQTKQQNPKYNVDK